MPYGYNQFGSSLPMNYPVSYATAPTPNYYQAPQPQTPLAEGVKWVQGEVGARAYPVQPGRMVVLMDSEDSVFYMKSVDAYGVPQPLRKFRFQEIVDEQKKISENSTSMQMNAADYITKEEFDQRLKEKLEELMK